MEFYFFAKLVEDMRTAQKQYFRTRSQKDLEQSKSLERAVDQQVKEIVGPKTRGLFTATDR